MAKPIAERRQGVGFITPLLVLMLAAFNLPILYMLTLGFWSKEGGFTFEHYAQLLDTPIYLRVLANTMRVSLVATLVNVAIGYPLAYWMRGLSPRAQFIAVSLVIVPFWISILVRTYAWIVVLGNNGMVNRLLLWSGMVDTPVSFLYNELGVMIGMANVLLPFLVLPLFAAMLRIDDRLMQAAASMGAPNHTIFLKVFLPLTLPALAAGTLLVFILCLGFYVTPAILGGGKVTMISNLLDILINQIPRWEQASAVSTLLLIVTLAIFAGYRALDRKVGT
ncbi:MAG: ABC transporter permease [Acetobacteraceae bacterium]|nr:ABC transporter permease [Acetobacteraceae bacterium]